MAVVYTDLNFVQRVELCFYVTENRFKNSSVSSSSSKSINGVTNKLILDGENGVADLAEYEY